LASCYFLREAALQCGISVTRLELQEIQKCSTIVKMIYESLPNFTSRDAWTVDRQPGDQYWIGDACLRTLSSIKYDGSAFVSNEEEQRLDRLQAIVSRGTLALRAVTEREQLTELAEINDTLSQQTTYALMHRRVKYWGHPEYGEQARIAILRGFILEPESSTPLHRVTTALEGKTGRLGRRYDIVHVMHDSSGVSS
jgi:hypothetical protein